MHNYIYLFHTDDKTIFRLYFTNEVVEKPNSTVLLKLMVPVPQRFEYQLMTEMTRLFKTKNCIDLYDFEGEPVDIINVIYKVWHSLSQHFQPVYPKNGLMNSICQYLHSLVRDKTGTIIISRDAFYKSYSNPYSIGIRKMMLIIRNDFKFSSIKTRIYKKLTHLFINCQLLEYQLNQFMPSLPPLSRTTTDTTDTTDDTQ